MKKYSDTSFNELFSSLNNNVNNNIIDNIKDIFNKTEIKYPGFRDKLVHDMGSFLTHWYDLVNRTTKCDNSLRSKILTYDFIMQYSDFNNVTVFIYDNINYDKKENSDICYQKYVLSYIEYMVKTVVNITRRKLGYIM